MCPYTQKLVKAAPAVLPADGLIANGCQRGSLIQALVRPAISCSMAWVSLA